MFNFFINTLTDQENFEDLRCIILGGEPFRGYEIEMFKKYFPGLILANVYGQTESSVNSIWTIRANDSIPHLVIGTPLDNTRIFIVDEDGDEVDTFEMGEIIIACPHVSPGYWQDKELTKKAFGRDSEYGSIYWTGDMGRRLDDGNIEFMGRKDFQVKIRGFRIELGEIETTILQIDGIKEAVVVTQETKKENTHLCAFFTAAKKFEVAELRNFLSGELPDYMLPLHFAQLEKMPLTQSGKIDRKALSITDSEFLKSNTAYAAPQTDMEKTIADTWKKVLGLEDVGLHDNLFEIGGNSFDIIKIINELSELLQENIPIVKAFEYPTIKDLADYLNQKRAQEKTIQNNSPVKKDIKRGLRLEIAVIGMAGRFPGAQNIAEFWENLKKGVESITFFSEEELIKSGLPPGLVKNPNYIKAKGMLENIEFFDAAFFNFTPTEALVMDPQLRLFHECCWETFENAGYNPANFMGAVGVYAGNTFNIGWLEYVYSQKNDSFLHFEKGFLNLHLSTYISYKLDLKGPSLTIRTACSTSLVAVHEACKGLLLNECDMALAGGVSIAVPKKSGYLYQEGMIHSADGHVRTFDTHSTGTVFGDGVGCVLLKRLEDALADGDIIHAIIRGSAVNNDGISKVGYTAPGIAGQREVIREAQIASGFEPESIGFIETHGTGTILGDAIEIEALNQVFPRSMLKYCALGSVKTNVGHLNAAAGITGFIKTVLSLKYKLIPPTINFEIPNAEIDFENSPFYINTKLIEWKNEKYPLRASVSSFGFGGTNAHVVLEEWFLNDICKDIGREYHLLLLSTKTQLALDRMTEKLGVFLDENHVNPAFNLGDVAYTLMVGRRHFDYRRMLVCKDINDAITALCTPDSRKVHTFFSREQEKAVIFMFPGLGSQYVNMGRELFETEPEFREQMNHCFEILKSLIDDDIEGILYPGKESESTALHEKIKNVEIAQIVIFIFAYALAQLLLKWGIKPAAVIGYSFGEYVAACLAGVFSLTDALKLITARGKLIRGLPCDGMMLSVPLPKEELIPHLSESLDIAIDNESSCIIAGPSEEIKKLQEQLKAKRCICMPMDSSYAIHSKMMTPILSAFTEIAGKIKMNNPQIPYISNLTGTWVTDEVLNPSYWSSHLSQTVQFAGGIKELLKKKNAIFIEVGPGRDLSTLVGRYFENSPGYHAVNLTKPVEQDISDIYYLLNKIGHLWLYGLKINWGEFYSKQKRSRISLPTYPFEKQYYWLDSDLLKKESLRGTGKFIQKASNADEWAYLPLWKRSIRDEENIEKFQSEANWLVFLDDLSLTEGLVKRLLENQQHVILVKKGDGFAKLLNNNNPHVYIINPGEYSHYDILCEHLQKIGGLPHHIIHCWHVTKETGMTLAKDFFDNAQSLAFYSLIYIVKAIEKQNISHNIQISFLTNDVYEVTGDETINPEKAPALGLLKSIPQESPNIICRNIDITLPRANSQEETILIDLLIEEFTSKLEDVTIAFRNNRRWVQFFEPFTMESAEKNPAKTNLKEQGVYLITGGMGKIGLIISEVLVKNAHARLILTGRSAFPPQQEWASWLQTHEDFDPISVKIKKLQQLQEMGGKILYFQADVAQEEQMQHVISQAETIFGQIQGVIHIAGIVERESIRLINQLSHNDCQVQFHAKVYGTLVLAELFKDKNLDFCLLFSSMSCILGGLGLGAYAGANAFLDVVVKKYNRLKYANSCWFSLNWDVMDAEKSVDLFKFKKIFE
ncbi:MAG: SDR family oxidoreductase, partial [Acidobacteria bacterium]|nr:SDR family oxidoreductase [Acidobacteriota bacterium]